MRTSPVPPKPAFFARLKSTNYLPNALAAADAQRMGFNQARAGSGPGAAGVHR